MQWQPYALLFLGGVVVCAVVGVQALRHSREIPAAFPLALCMFALAQWALVESVAASLTSLAARGWWHLAIFPGVAVNCVGFYWLVRTLVDGRVWFRPRTWALLAVEPVTISVLAATNPWHHLVIASMTQTGHPSLLQVIGGPAFWAHAAYSYGLLGWSVGIVLRHWRHASALFRRQATPILIGMAFPTAVNLVTLARETGGGHADLTVLGFIALSSMTWWTVRRHGLLRYSPVARGLVFDRVTDPLLVVDSRRRLLDFNPAAERLLRAARPELSTSLVGIQVEGFLPPGAPVVASGESAEFTLDLGGQAITLDVRVSPLTDRRGAAIGHVIVARDITEFTKANLRLREQLTVIEELQRTLSEQAVRDPLTGLHNRRYLMTELTADLLRCREAGHPLGVVLIDLDHFKVINDRYGHATGDEALRLVARTLTADSREQDTIARYGGEEFVVLLPGATPATAARRAREWLDACARLQVPTPQGCTGVTFSVGIACYPQDATDPEDLLQTADEALYTAKRLGRNRIHVAGTPTAQPLATTGSLEERST